MRELLFIVIILLIQRRQVNCKPLFDFIQDQFHDIQDSMLSSLKTVGNNLLHLFRTLNSIVVGDLSHIHDVSNLKHNIDAPKMRRRHKHLSLNLSPPATITPRIPQNESADVKPTYREAAHLFTTPQLSASDGRIIETHVTITLDGYVLTLHRLHSRPTNNLRDRRTILLHHGLLGSSADWILLGPNKSLPYILSDAGHDIWMANSRGNYYSRAHVTLEYNPEKYWNFSWQEIGEYDLPATLDYIRKTKNSTEPIDYIGHSMGATALLVLLSVKSNYNSYFRIAILLAPLVFMTHTRGPLRLLATMEDSELVKTLGTTEFMPNGKTLPHLSFSLIHDPEDYCSNPLFYLTGVPLQNDTRTKEFQNMLNEYSPAGGSTKTIRHYIDLIKNRQFHHYGTPDRKFELRNISAPILIISSNDDSTSNVTDNMYLYLSLGNPVGHIIIQNKNLSHTEFAWGSTSEMLFYYKIKDIIDDGPEVNHI